MAALIGALNSRGSLLENSLSSNDCLKFVKPKLSFIYLLQTLFSRLNKV